MLRTIVVFAGLLGLALCGGGGGYGGGVQLPAKGYGHRPVVLPAPKPVFLPAPKPVIPVPVVPVIPVPPPPPRPIPVPVVPMAIVPRGIGIRKQTLLYSCIMLNHTLIA